MGKEYMVRLPWPPSKTSKNGSQGDVFGKARAAKGYKTLCAWDCKDQGIGPVTPYPDGTVEVVVTYYPPDKRRNDWDNLATRAKQGFDAVSEAIGVDDGNWWPVTCEKGVPVKGGAVLVTIKGAE